MVASAPRSPSLLVPCVIKALKSRRPRVFTLYTPCPIEPGLADNGSRQAARLALESRAFPYFTYDPDAGPTIADCLSLQGNPSVDQSCPTFKLRYQTADVV